MSAMPAPSPFVDHCLELLGALGQARARRMFGGHGLYLDDLFIALIVDETLYLKTDADSTPRFDAAGCKPFRYTTARGEAKLSYWTAPEEALESPVLIAPWVRLAQAAALRARAAPARRTR